MPKRTQHIFIIASEGSFVHAAILPNDDGPAAGLENAAEFALRGGDIEPVKGLADGDEIHGRERRAWWLPRNH